jgi:histidinol-phosphatase
MLSGARGLGAWWNGRRARVSGVKNLSEATLIITDYVSLYGKDEAVKRLCGAAKLVRGWGDCYGYALVATGRAEVVLDPKMNVWDCAALAPIMEEAGGTFTTWDGRATIWGDEAVATNGALFDAVMDVIKKA